MEQYNLLKLKIVYTKEDEIKYISHLDHIRVLERALRRANIPMAYSQGFNPRMKISFKTRALKVGETSNNCEAELLLTEGLSPDIFTSRINAVLPKGMRVLSALGLGG